MNVIVKLVRADTSRKTRFHTSNGYLCLRPNEFVQAFVTTIARRFLKRYSSAPWLVYSATAHIAPLVSGKRVFEFGSGMSTLWFAERSLEVVSVENNPEWYFSVVSRAREQSRKNVRVIYADSRAAYLAAIDRAGGKFDIILIDGSYRKDCVEMARSYLNPQGIAIVDNTDADTSLASTVRNLFRDSSVLVFHGWVPGTLHPNETTVIESIPT